MDKRSKYVSIVYAILLLIGGAIGFIKAGSVISLGVGILSCTLIIVSCKVGDKDPKSGYFYITSISLVLASFFIYRFIKTHHFMPGGLMAVLSTINCLVTGFSLLKMKKQFN